MRIWSHTHLAILAAVFIATMPASAQQKGPSAAQKSDSTGALAKMKKTVDKMEDITWYTDKTTPETNNRNNIHLYIGQKSGNALLRIKYQYASDDWLFIRKFMIKTDSQKFDRDGRFERDHHHGKIWEWMDTPATKEDLQMVKAIISSKEATVRYNGAKYYDDRTISAAEKKAMQNVLDAYAALGGKEPLR